MNLLGSCAAILYPDFYVPILIFLFVISSFVISSCFLN